MTFAGRPETPGGQPSETREEEHFMQKEHQKSLEKTVGDQLGVVTGVQGREESSLV